MKMSKTHPILKIMNHTFIDMPSPLNISFYWNFGSLIGLMLLLQMITGLLMTFHFSPDITLAFSSIILSTRNLTKMWLIRWMHANGASLMFLLIYLHIARNLYYSSFNKKMTWLTGMMIFTIMMTIAFLGYVLPWGQMSYWGVTVITNLLSTIPLIGPDIVTWIWGDYSVNNPTLKRFYTLHFLLPFIMLILIILHLAFLHQQGSTNPLGLQNFNEILHFHPYFTIKDLFGLLLTTTLFIMFILMYPLMFNDPENFINANPMLTPIHIQPEWYFLFAYAILRSIPSKIGGVIALAMSILILFILPTFPHNKLPNKFNPMKKMLTWSFITTFLILTWIGMNPTTYPFTMVGNIFSLMYFILILLHKPQQ